MKTKLVALGASAGGLTALENFFKHIPKNPGCAFVIVQHLSPDFKSLMGQLLSAYTDIPIQEVTAGLTVEPDHIYLIPAGRLMRIKENIFDLQPRNPEKMPINIFMQSMADTYGAECAGVILSGTGSDGTEGCRAIREVGGLVIAQTPETAEFESMPKSIITKNISHAQAAPKDMWHLIENYNGNPEALDKLGPPPEASADEPLELVENLNIGYVELFAFLKRLYNIDFSSYKIASVSRRIQRRMEQCSIEDVSKYLSFLEENEYETDALYRDLLIGVTAFFRDAEVYSCLAENVLQPAFENLAESVENDEFRIWVAACASGEEAYSLAILTDEIARAHNFAGVINIFATDIHKGTVDLAGKGIYTKNELENVSEERIQRYFKVTEDGRFRVKPEIRKRVIFAHHNLLSDPPFTRIDLITCRNLLIYLKPDAQEMVLRSFQYSLKPEAHLMLGTSESLGPLEDDFKTVASREKIFRKIGSRAIAPRPRQMFKSQSKPLNIIPTPSSTRTVSIDRDLLNTYDLILRKHAPAGVLISSSREIKHYFGDGAKYCKPSEGRVDNDFLSLLAGDLKLAVSTSIQRVVSKGNTVKSKGIRCETREGEETVIDVTVEPYPGTGSEVGMMLITFSPRQLPGEMTEVDAENESVPGQFLAQQEAQARILMLEDELRSAKENLQATVEELQTSNEELQAINEEVQVSNEELQSTNEELHSMNEELYTVNSELQQKNQQLVDLNNEHENLLTNTEDGILYIDRDMRIKKFNPAIAFAFNLLPQDLGRPVEHIAYNLRHREEMLDDLRNVLKTGVRKEREARTEDGVIYLRRFTPFLDENGEVNGVVLTFTDITESSQMRERLSRAMRTAGMAWWEWDLTTDRLDVHAEGECILGYDCATMDNDSAYWFSRVPPEEIDHVRTTLDDCINGVTDEWLCEHRYMNAAGEYEWVLDSGKVTRRGRDGKALEMAGTTMNINRRKTMELDLRASKEAAESAMIAKANFLSTMSHEIRTPLNGITGMAELLKLESKDPGLSRYIDTINESANILLELIGGILDYSKAEAGKLELNLEYTNVHKLIDGTVKVMRGKAEEKRVRLDADVQLQHDSYKVDRIRLRQVLMNLLSNAVKFTPEGGHASILVRDFEDQSLEFKVQDSGIGIDAETQKTLFDPFTQADSSFARAYGGTGLGLSICKQLVELMGGFIDVISAPGKGSTFIFTIPSSGLTKSSPVTDDGDEVSFTPLPEGAIKAMVVDDDKTNAEVMSLMLSKCGATVDCVDSAHACIEKLKETPYNLLFLDLHMPEATGFHVAERIRAGEFGEEMKHIPLIAFTADVAQSTRRKAQGAGFKDVLYKPTSMAQIKRVLHDLSIAREPA
jgi:two-component system CheB/CheR fusion protein